MPIFDYECGDRHRIESFFKAGEEIPLTMICPFCQQPAIKQLSAPAHTPGRWGDQTGKYGVNGFYDRGLGATYHNSMEREALMDKKGLVDAGSFGKHALDDGVEKHIEDDKRHTRDIERYKQNLRDAKGEKGQALAETFSVKEMQKRGDLDSGVKG